MKKTSNIAYLGIFTALAMIFSYIEFLIPFSIGIPGIKLGLANIVVLFALYTMGEKEALFISCVRILLMSMLFANLSVMVYSLAGGLLSLLVMVLAKRSRRLGMVGVSVLGGIFHNAGQLIVAMLVLETRSLWYYGPVLFLAGILTGLAIGIVGEKIEHMIEF